MSRLGCVIAVAVAGLARVAAADPSPWLDGPGSAAGSGSGAPGAAPAEATDDDDAFSVMKLLAAHGDHDLAHERWNAYGQLTYISSWKRPFDAPYTNLNGSNHSLLPTAERSFTFSATAFVGVRLWHGAELYLVPELISERPLSDLAGLGGVIQNFELQKSGGVAPTVYLSRKYISQTIDLGGDISARASHASALAGPVDSRRVVISVGNFSILDFFDKNSYAGDGRREFLNMAFLTHSAYDFAADARGYAWGGVAELFWDDWSARVGRITPPKDPNQLPIDFRIWKYYGDQLELEHDHQLGGLAGSVRLLGYRNRENIGNYADAIAAFQANPQESAANCGDQFNYGSTNAGAPDLCWVRKPATKLGAGINLEQQITRDVGVFARGLVSDGKTEVYSYTSADRSASIGALAKGGAWRRPTDLLGLGYGAGWISSSHAAFLNLGGVDGFIGDGRLRQGSERVVDAFYSLAVYRSLWVAGDYQRIWDPGFNADRGPVTVLGARVHGEF